MPLGLQSTHLMILLVTGLMCLIPVFIVGVGVYILVSRSGKSQEQAAVPTSLDILKMRYAKGEITQDQFLKMKSDLS